MLNENMKKLRADKELSMKELSLRSGVSERYLYFIENGEKTPSMKTARLIANALGSTIESLFFAPSEN